MNKHFKVITINGIRGIFAAIFIAACLFAGFVISPAWCCAAIWNYAADNYFNIPHVQFYQGLLMWAAAALILCVLNNKEPLVCFGPHPKLSKNQVRQIIKKAREEDKTIFCCAEKNQKSSKNEEKAASSEEPSLKNENESGIK